MRTALLALVLLVVFAATGSATVPSTLGYQGVLSDNLGNVQPDGLYNFVFKIYTVGSGGSAIWTETDNNVQVTKGSFTVLLGNVSSLTALAFDVPYYLGLSVNGQAELTPRVPLASSAYGLSLRLPFAGNETSGGPIFSVRNLGSGPDLLSDHYLQVGSVAEDGFVSLASTSQPAGIVHLYDFFGLGSRPAGPQVTTGTGGAADFFDNSGVLTTSIQPDVDGGGAGYLYVNSNGAGNYFQVDGSSGGSGSPRVNILGNSPIVFDSGASGDASVQLPANAIDSNEILDEPGIAQGKLAGTVLVTSVGTMADVVTVTLTTPAPGYIVVNANAQSAIGGVAGNNYIIAQIDDTAGGTEDPNHSEWVGGSNVPNVGTFYWPYTNTRTYYEASPGTYTFRLEAERASTTGASNYFYNPTITATYYPTSYGPTTTLVSANEAGRFASPQTVTVKGQDGTTVTAARVDLRDLESQVARERTRLAEAETRLRAAQTARQNQAAAAARARSSSLKPARGASR